MLQKVIWNFLNYVSTNLSVSKTRSYFMTSCRFGVATSGKMEFSWEVTSFVQQFNITANPSRTT